MSHRKRRGFFRRFWWLWLLILLLPLVAAGILAAVLFTMYQDIELPGEPPLAQTSRIYDFNGDLLMEIATPVDRDVVHLEDVSENMKNAIIATEDEDFYTHPGVSPIAIVRAAWADIRNQELAQGGSTITQQYIKNVSGEDEVSIKRKIQEALMAIKLENVTKEACEDEAEAERLRCAKDQILEKYLNTIYFGHGAYGVEAAAQTYFGVPAKKLGIAQSATLAGLVAAPSAYDPLNNPKASTGRRDYALDRMQIEGYITAEQGAKAKGVAMKRLTRHHKVNDFENFSGDYFAWYARGRLVDEYGEKDVIGKGLNVRTTLDPEVQELAEEAVYGNVGVQPENGDPDAALVAIDPSNGEIVAMVGGQGFADRQFNLATDGRRQSGSSFKSFTLLAAMQAGYKLHGDGWYGPEVATIKDEQCLGADGSPWQPANAADGEAGTFDLAGATAHSVNTVFAQLVMAEGIGPEKVAQVAKKAGIESDLDPVCSITLGTQLVSPLEMTSAYATLAANGEYHEPTPIKWVRGPAPFGKESWASEGHQKFDENDVALVTEALEGVVTSGTGVGASLGAQPVAGKTGTAQDYKDAWFCGYTPELATCVWVGYDRHPHPMVAVAPYGTIFGGTIPADIFQEFMSGMYELEGWPVEQFPDAVDDGDLSSPDGSLSSPAPDRSVDEEPAPDDEPSPDEEPPPDDDPPDDGGGGGGGDDDPGPEPSP